MLVGCKHRVPSIKDNFAISKGHMSFRNVLYDPYMSFRSVL